MRSEGGFTLIELSIVLIIIGLIVGGVLVGRDLIHAAEIRGTVKQVEQIDAAVNTFRLKFSCLPGDCSNATALGLTANGASGIANGNGDGLIYEVVQVDGSYASESANALHQLKEAGVIDGTKRLDIGGGDWRDVMVLKIADGSSGPQWMIEYMTPFVAHDIQDFTSSVLSSGDYYWATREYGNSNVPSSISTMDAFAIDSKVDDGFPRSGKALATRDSYVQLPIANDAIAAPYFDASRDAGPAGADSNYCVTDDSPNRYNVLNSNLQNTPWGCTMTIQASF